MFAGKALQRNAFRLTKARTSSAELELKGAAEYTAELFDRGDSVRKAWFDTGRGRARPESDKDIQRCKRASRRGERVAARSPV
jgi:phage repressor protein C with HTH and peptisase S24 domain